MIRTGAVVSLFFVCVAFAADTRSTEWPTYGHDPGGMRFSPLKQISPSNVARLKVAWMYHMRPAPAPGKEPSGLAGSETTPIVAGGMMYIATPYNRVVALDPTTGKEVWVFRLPSGNPSTRGVEYWPGDAQTPAQIVFGSTNGRLFSPHA